MHRVRAHTAQSVPALRALFSGEDVAAPQSAPVPVELVTASASGLDPDISVAYAELQVNRVAEARGIPAREVGDLVAAQA